MFMQVSRAKIRRISSDVATSATLSADDGNSRHRVEPFHGKHPVGHIIMRLFMRWSLCSALSSPNPITWTPSRQGCAFTSFELRVTRTTRATNSIERIGGGTMQLLLGNNFRNLIFRRMFAQWRRLHGARAGGGTCPSPHFYKWLGTGGTVSRRTANNKLTKLY